MAADPQQASTRSRVEAFDVLRGLVVVLMTIDHAREYSNGPGSVTDPMQLDQVEPLLFWMRWVTHFCAPVFTLLAGVSSGLQGHGASTAGTAPWSWHLITRGLILVLLEFTVVHLAWTFSLVWPMRYAQVIWGIGMSLIVLGCLQRVPVTARLALGVLLVAGHNALDGWHPTSPTWLHWSWAVLHDRQVMPLWGDIVVRTSYPIMPMIGLVLLGDALGRWYRVRAHVTRPRVLAGAGVLMLSLFVLLRATNVYGDPHVAVYSDSALHTVMAALNVTKYPMSLSFVLMTLGPAFLLLAAWDAKVQLCNAPLATMGQVPMFLYVAHLYLLHVLALLWAMASGLAWSTFDFRATITGLPNTFGFPLWQTFPFVVVTLLLLYPAAVWYARVRAARRYRITRYL
jgi:uncharacterized membrane protein